MDEETKRAVRTRASQRCEYCRIPQSIYPDFTFHIEHNVARQHGGKDEPDNLALSCHLENCKKGPIFRASIRRPVCSLDCSIHAPDRWNEHFRDAEDGRISGLTDVGRTTVHLLDMNSEIRTRIRREIRRLGED